MKESIINVFGRWIDVSRIIIITEPKATPNWSGASSSIDFYINYEMMDSPIRMVAYDKNHNQIFFESIENPREADSLKGFWRDYDALLQKWIEFKNK